MRTFLLEWIRAGRDGQRVGTVNSIAYQKETMEDVIDGKSVSQQTCCPWMWIGELQNEQ